MQYTGRYPELSIANHFYINENCNTDEYKIYCRLTGVGRIEQDVNAKLHDLYVSIVERLIRERIGPKQATETELLKCEISELKERIGVLETHMKYMPGGEGYQEAELHFNKNI